MRFCRRDFRQVFAVDDAMFTFFLMLEHSERYTGLEGEFIYFYCDEQQYL